ncbi:MULTISPECIES: hypothetical protein [Flavobacteriaceae]|jgi:hypothetical protein|uniref:hypothetical protein n=1 Tax=Flavobacteriaceae TaxID=49546 RepID=UPI00101B6F3B|nr:MULTISPECIES: hypothetical protein [Flavobacteriaceae]RYH76176.1 hypothetical protein EVU94_04230 [Flavobacteriaceae bacterium 144Ye]TBV28253.1 hypothetical protein DMZ43_04220 [Meridianimaribacter sp. CL38]
MNSAFKSRQLSFLVQNIIFTLVLFGLHSYLLSYFATDISFFFPVWQIYVFHFVITTLLYTVINYKYSSGKTEVFNVFMMSTFLKMILAIVFLLPLLLSDKENRQPDVFNFFIPYFLYLFFEVFSLTKFLQKTP